MDALEFQTLADDFNHMASQLQASYATLEQQVEERTRALARSVQELQALGAVSQTVNSTLDLQTVLTTIVSHAVRLSGGHGGIIYEYDEDTRTFHLKATYGMPNSFCDSSSTRTTERANSISRLAKSRNAVCSCPGGADVVHGVL